jgi:MinD-like ATPase involved in chromosome partitioning or flagellar assembly
MTSVVVAAGGALWEADVIDEIRRAGSLSLQRRCLDLAEVLALAEHCDVAILSTDLNGLDVDSVLALERNGVRVIGIGDGDRAMRLGMEFARPGGIEAALHEPLPVPPASEGEVIAVWGPHGAPGRSVVAASVAAALVEQGRGVMLIDADSRGGAQAQMFALLDDVSGLVAACRSANHGDLHDVLGHSIDVEPGLRLLSGVAKAEMWAQVRQGPFERVLRLLAEDCDVVVVDLGPGLGDVERHVLSVARQVVVVGRADPVGLARLVRSLHDLHSMVDADPVVVVNEVRSTSAWTQRDVSDAIARLAGRRPDVFVPADHRTLDTAVLRGKVPAQVAPKSPFVAAIGLLMERMWVIPSR